MTLYRLLQACAIGLLMWGYGIWFVWIIWRML